MSLAFSATAAQVVDASNLDSYPLVGTVVALPRDLVLVVLSRWTPATSIESRLFIQDSSGGAAFRWVQLLRRDGAAINQPGIAVFAATCRVNYTGSITVRSDQLQRGMIAGCWTLTGASLAAPFRSDNRTSGRGAAGNTTGVFLPRSLSSGTHVCLVAVTHQAHEAIALDAGYTKILELGVTDAANSTANGLTVGWKLGAVSTTTTWATASAFAYGAIEVQEPAYMAEEPGLDPPRPLWLVEVTPALVG
jgi:hypothetical protein